MTREQIEIAKDHVAGTLCDRNGHLLECIWEQVTEDLEVENDTAESDRLWSVVDRLMCVCQDAAKDAIENFDLETLYDQGVSSESERRFLKNPVS